MGGATAGWLGVLALVLPVSAGAHAALTAASPSADSVAEGPPAVVELTFSEAVEPRFSTIMVKTDKNRRMDRGAAYLVSDPMHLAIALQPLTPGHYRVEWRATAADTHRSSGAYGFTVLP